MEWSRSASDLCPAQYSSARRNDSFRTAGKRSGRARNLRLTSIASCFRPRKRKINWLLNRSHSPRSRAAISWSNWLARRTPSGNSAR